MSGLNYGNKYTICRAERPLYSLRSRSKEVFVFNKKGNLVNTYKNVYECEKLTGINKTTIIKKIKRRQIYKGFYYSYNNYLNPNTNFI